MVDDTDFHPSWASPPGETISDCLQRRSLSLLEFADQIGCSLEAANQLICGETAIDQELAELLDNIIGGSARFWLSREVQYRDDLRRVNILHDTATALDWLDELPVRDMIDFGWIQGGNDKFDLALECLRFFNAPSVSSWRKHYKTIGDVVAFRNSGAFESRLGAVAAWLRQGEREADEIACKPWNSDRFRQRLWDSRALTRRKDPEFFVPELRQLCAECGVAVALVRAPTGCRASGATKFLSPVKALLLLSFRYRSDDHFWFTFFHEAGHLLLHDRNALFVEGTDMLSTHEEEEADEFSKVTLVPPQHHDEMLALGRNYRKVMRFARHVGVSPGIIVGQLQHRGHLARNQMNFLKRRFVWQDDQWRVIRGTG